MELMVEESNNFSPWLMCDVIDQANWSYCNKGELDYPLNISLIVYSFNTP